MNIVAGGGLSGLSFSHFFNDNCTIIDSGLTRINSIFKKSFLDLGAQFFSKEDLNFIQLVENLNLQSKLKETNFNNFYIEKNNSLIKINSTNYKSLSKDETEEIKLFKNFIKNSETFILNNYQELQNTSFDEWYKKTCGGESIWIIDSLFRSITFSNAKELNALYGLIASQSFFTKTYTFHQGMNYITNTLKKDKKIINSNINFIEFNKNTIDITLTDDKKISCKKLISAIPSNSLSKLTSIKELSKNLSKIPYAGCKVLIIETKKNLTYNKLGLITPEKKIISTILKNNNYYTILAPYTKFPPTEEQILNELNLSSKEGSIIVSSYWDYSLPTCTKKLHLIQEKILEITDQQNNFAICGDFMGLPSLDACVESAKKAAEKLNKN